VVRRAITGFTPRRHSSRRYLSWFVAAVGDYLVRALARPAAFARDGADAIDEREQLRHVVAISAGQLDAQWQPVKVHDQVMFRARAGVVNW
jgi:hypothetical protein